MPVLCIRCDGDETVGAGHVARCLPLARAFAERGWDVLFDGRYSGLAERLLGDMPRGSVHQADAAIVDSYERQTLPDIPIATIGEAMTYPGAVLIDYHLDRIDQAPDEHLLPGPSFAPLDPRFARAGRAGTPVRDALVTVGGSTAAREVIPRLEAELRETFPGVQVHVASGAGSLLDVVGHVDVAVTGAGLTAYELACAGLPIALVQLADNQRRVVEGSVKEGIAVTDVRALLPGPNLRGMALFDGRGAARAAAALEDRWPLH